MAQQSRYQCSCFEKHKKQQEIITKQGSKGMERKVKDMEGSNYVEVDFQDNLVFHNK